MNMVTDYCKNCGTRLLINQKEVERFKNTGDDSAFFCYACFHKSKHFSPWLNGRKCECGGDIAKSLGHSEWCPKYEDISKSKITRKKEEN